MKTIKKVTKKLVLNSKIVSHLNPIQLNQVAGGVKPEETEIACSICNCDTNA